MKLLPIAVEKKRWDLVAHAIVLATANVLNNGGQPHTGKGVTNIPATGITRQYVMEHVMKTEGREFERKKRSSKRQSER